VQLVLAFELLLARLTNQYCFARWRLSSSAERVDGLAADTPRRPVMLRPFTATPCLFHFYYYKYMCYRFMNNSELTYLKARYRSVTNQVSSSDTIMSYGRGFVSCQGQNWLLYRSSFISVSASITHYDDDTATSTHLCQTL